MVDEMSHEVNETRWCISIWAIWNFQCWAGWRSSKGDKWWWLER